MPISWRSAGWPRAGVSAGKPDAYRRVGRICLALRDLVAGGGAATGGSGDAWLTLTASRLPRLAALVLTGVGLSVCGVILQHLVRNKFVEPATSGGLDAAKLGILLSLALVPAASVAVRMLFALVVCFAAGLLFVLLIRRIQFKSTVLVPVIGLMYGGVLSAIAEFYAYRHNIMQSMQGWLLGDFSRGCRAVTKSST